MISVHNMTLEQILTLHAQCCNHIRLIKSKPGWYRDIGIVEMDLCRDRDEMWAIAESMISKDHIRMMYRLVGMTGKKSMWKSFFRDVFKLWAPYDH